MYPDRGRFGSRRGSYHFLPISARARKVHLVTLIVSPHPGRGSSVTASVFGEDKRGPSRRVRQGPDADLFEVDDVAGVVILEADVSGPGPLRLAAGLIPLPADLGAGQEGASCHAHREPPPGPGEFCDCFGVR